MLRLIRSKITTRVLGLLAVVTSVCPEAKSVRLLPHEVNIQSKAILLYDKIKDIDKCHRHTRSVYPELFENSGPLENYSALLHNIAFNLILLETLSPNELISFQDGADLSITISVAARNADDRLRLTHDENAFFFESFPHTVFTEVPRHSTPRSQCYWAMTSLIQDCQELYLDLVTLLDTLDRYQPFKDVQQEPRTKLQPQAWLDRKMNEMYQENKITLNTMATLQLGVYGVCHYLCAVHCDLIKDVNHLVAYHPMYLPYTILNQRLDRGVVSQ